MAYTFLTCILWLLVALEALYWDEFQDCMGIQHQRRWWSISDVCQERRVVACVPYIFSPWTMWSKVMASFHNSGPQIWLSSAVPGELKRTQWLIPLFVILIQSVWSVPEASQVVLMIRHVRETLHNSDPLGQCVAKIKPFLVPIYKHKDILLFGRLHGIVKYGFSQPHTFHFL